MAGSSRSCHGRDILYSIAYLSSWPLQAFGWKSESGNQLKTIGTTSIPLTDNHDINQGKGAAIHTGIAQATGEYLLVQDADLAPADVVYGSRFMGGNPHRILFFWHSIGYCQTYFA